MCRNIYVLEISVPFAITISSRNRERTSSSVSLRERYWVGEGKAYSHSTGYQYQSLHGSE